MEKISHLSSSLEPRTDRPLEEQIINYGYFHSLRFALIDRFIAVAEKYDFSVPEAEKKALNDFKRKEKEALDSVVESWKLAHTERFQWDEKLKAGKKEDLAETAVLPALIGEGLPLPMVLAFRNILRTLATLPYEKRSEDLQSLGQGEWEKTIFVGKEVFERTLQNAEVQKLFSDYPDLAKLYKKRFCKAILKLNEERKKLLEQAAENESLRRPFEQFLPKQKTVYTWENAALTIRFSEELIETVEK